MAFSIGQNGYGGRSRFRGSTGALSEINVVPLVDVVLVLLIIFMLTAHVMEFGLEVEVPQVKEVRDTAESCRL
jgi:biopolymer transport protein ExbD